MPHSSRLESGHGWRDQIPQPPPHSCHSGRTVSSIESRRSKIPGPVGGEVDARLPTEITGLVPERSPQPWRTHPLWLPEDHHDANDRTNEANCGEPIRYGMLVKR